MSLLRPRHSFLVFLGAVLAAGVLLTVASWRDARFTTGRIERVMLAQGQTIAALVTESWTHGAESYHLWEDEVAARLLDNARWVARQDSVRPLTSRELARLASLHRLGRINLFDGRGAKTASSVVESDSGLAARHDPRDYIAPILRGEARELRIGFKPARFRGGRRFAVAVARRGGGAVVVNVFADSMQAILESVRPGHLLGMLGTANGVRYVTLATPDGVIAATPGAPRAPWPPEATPARGASAGAPAVRELDAPGGRVYEILHRVRYGAPQPALLRIGLDAGALDQARRELRSRIWLRGAMYLAFGLLMAGLLLVWQRHGVLAREVAAARSELEAREQERQRTGRLAAMGEMAAQVAHEVRNPLNTIHMIAQELVRGPATGEEARSRAADLRAESQRIESIVQQFLDLSRPRVPRPEPMDVGDAVAAAGRAVQPAFAAAGVALDVSAESRELRLDPLMLQEVLGNLLRNAREASPPGTRVTLDCRREGEGVAVRVEDQGPGVPPELREKIFDLYFTTKRGGSGLGLGLASQLTAAMGGTLRFEPASHGGARFVVRFPAPGEGA